MGRGVPGSTRPRLTVNSEVAATTPLTTPLTPSRFLSRLGVSGVDSDPASLNGVLVGSAPLVRPPLGCCAIWGCRPSLWLPVVQALGFRISELWFPPSPFSDFCDQHWVSLFVLAGWASGLPTFYRSPVWSAAIGLPSLRLSLGFGPTAPIRFWSWVLPLPGVFPLAGLHLPCPFPILRLAAPLMGFLL